jgi:hypothetical protein
MVTVLKECDTEEQRYVVRFLWAIGLTATDIHKEVMPVYGGKCLSRKAVHNWVKKFSQRRTGLKGNAEMAETPVKRVLCCAFRRTGIAMVQVYQCWWRIYREMNVFFFPDSNITCLCVIICDLFTDSPSYKPEGRVFDS